MPFNNDTKPNQEKLEISHLKDKKKLLKLRDKRKFGKIASNIHVFIQESYFK